MNAEDRMDRVIKVVSIAAVLSAILALADIGTIVYRSIQAPVSELNCNCDDCECCGRGACKSKGKAQGNGH